MTQPTIESLQAEIDDLRKKMLFNKERLADVYAVTVAVIAEMNLHPARTKALLNMLDPTGQLRAVAVEVFAKRPKG